MKLIDNTQDLSEFCANLRQHSYVTLDTEFLREHTFWPKLCLIQAAAPTIDGMIDPLAKDIDLAPFYELLQDKNTIKVMHGCRQDIEIFHKQARIIPAPLFDTQIAAMVCGFGNAVSYEMLVKKTTDGKVDKSSRFTDWSKRPLSEAQLNYARGDVTHLRGVYEYLKGYIERTGRETWVEGEMAQLTAPETYQQLPENAWKRLRLHDRRTRVFAVLIEVAAWRERIAQSQDIPRGRVLRDDTVREIAIQAPKTRDALKNLRGISHNFEQSERADSLLAAIKKGRATKEEHLPALPPIVNNRPNIAALVDLLKVLLKHCSETNHVAPKLIANTADLERIASDDEVTIDAVQGWRYDIFGKYALKLKAGKLALACENDCVKLIEL